MIDVVIDGASVNTEITCRLAYCVSAARHYFLNIAEYLHGRIVIVWGRKLHAIKQPCNRLDIGIYES